MGSSDYLIFPFGFWNVQGPLSGEDFPFLSKCVGLESKELTGIQLVKLNTHSL